MKKKIIGIITVIALLVVLMPQIIVIAETTKTGTIVGKTNTYDAYVTLYDSGYNMIETAMSDENGNFTFSNVPEGTGYMIIAFKLDYVTNREDNITVIGEKTTEVYIFIPKGDASPQEGIDISDNPIISVGKVTSCEGGIVDIPVTISENTGIYGVSLELYYFANKMTPISVIKGEALADGSLTYDVSTISSTAFIKTNLSNDELITEDCELFTVRFRINDDLLNYNLPLTLNYVRYTDENAETKEARIEFGDVNITTLVYDIANMRITNTSGEEIETIPANTSFIVETDIKKLLERDAKDYLFVAVYDTDGALISLDYVKAKFSVDGEYSFGFSIPPQEKSVGSVKAFVWNTFNSMEPLAENKTLSFTE